MADARDDFDFGASVTLETETATAFVRDLLGRAAAVVGHDIAADVRYLARVGVEMNEDGLVDTQLMFKHWSRTPQVGLFLA